MACSRQVRTEDLETLPLSGPDPKTFGVGPGQLLNVRRSHSTPAVSMVSSNHSCTASSTRSGDHVDVALLSMSAGIHRGLSPPTHTPRPGFISSPHDFCIFAVCIQTACTVLASTCTVAAWPWLQGNSRAADRRHFLKSVPTGGDLLRHIPHASGERRLRGGLHHRVSKG